MNILYGVPGEGMGHATRSKVIIKHLLKNHNIKIVSSSRAFEFLNKLFPDKVYEIQGFNFVYKDGEVKKLKTFQKIIDHGPHNLIENLSIYNKIRKEFEPDIIITDFESSAYLYGKYLRIPIIDIDNIQVMTRCKLEIEIPDNEMNNFTVAKATCKIKTPGCNHYLLSTFFNPPVIKENTVLIPPILRQEIIDANTRIDDHILVYQTSTSQNNLVDVLNEVYKEKFLVYGCNTDEVKGNCTLKKFSETGFIDDLASCKAIVTNGGYSLISEAIFLKKPICAYPIGNQFEQFMNAAYIEKLNYGRHLKEFNADGIKAFLYNLEVFQENLNSYSQNGNEDTFSKLDELLAKYNS